MRLAAELRPVFANDTAIADPAPPAGPVGIGCRDQDPGPAVGQEHKPGTPERLIAQADVAADLLIQHASRLRPLSTCTHMDPARASWCSAPFFLSTWKRAGVIRREHADPGRAAAVRFHARRHRERPAARRWPGCVRDARLAFTVSSASAPGGPGTTAPGRAGCNTGSPWRGTRPRHRGHRAVEGLPCCCAPIWRAASWPARSAAPGGWPGGGHGRERVIRLLDGATARLRPDPGPLPLLPPHAHPAARLVRAPARGCD